MSNTIFSSSWEEYKNLLALNHSRLKLMEKSPWHYSHYQEMSPTKEQEFGTRFHELLLEPTLFDSKYLVEPYYSTSGRSKEGKEERARFAAQHPNMIFIDNDEFAMLRSMREAVMTDPYAKQIFESGQPELTAVWDDDGTGIACKARLDWVSDAISNVPVDVKTTRDANPDNLSRACYNYGYYTQAAFYMRGWETIYGKKADGFLFVFVEKPTDPQATPLPPQIYELSPEFLRMGSSKVREWLKKLAELQSSKTEDYPHYTEGLSILNPPAWAKVY
jgi:hypothetical protein